MGLSFNYFCVMAPETAEFGRMTQNGRDYAVYGHSTSPIWVPI